MQLGLFSEESVYRRTFEKLTGPSIYEKHINENYISCIFCIHLKRTQCHEYCFSCSQSIYKDCSSLLPGTFHFSDSYFDAIGPRFTPWVFRTPCTRFERLKSKAYFKNFQSADKSITAANYEVLEGIFAGICRGKRPCHVCASVNLEIFNRCSDKDLENKPCSSITGEITRIYRVTSGMTIYAE